ncbi:hypothetical protein PR202_ga20265 [Eleusine coracana subsp. coracana]|uniref:Protein kinase domain-containing protein n=1 Tax=Eleusine coracana subsp. coracana TaxID=191504 RepID=A0AAV5CXE1_ELECO|nr:hypothetical protein QOZ80_4AG0316790 [Eleusine coracana subsp. coracana]GJN02876.1 hypothetical protein PR202_ga20265 [Eleusine coracana subsp. coracana]
MSSPPPHHLLSVLALIVIFPPLLLASSSFPLPTIAIAAVSSNTSSSSPHYLACALVPGNGGAEYNLSCASLTNRSAPPHTYSYGGGGTTPFTAVVAGDGYLCSAGPTSDPTMSMRWWDLKKRSRDAPNSKRVYSGAALSAVSGGGEYACGLVGERIKCWRWARGAVTEDVAFSAVAAGGEGFVCGLVARTGEVRCYGDGDGDDGGDAAVVGREPMGRHAFLAAGERHACAVRVETGELACWGDAAPRPKIAGRAVSAVAAGDGVTCVLWGNWTVSCWPDPEAAPPAGVARRQFVALEARGKAVCGVLMSDYSLVCWGPGVDAAGVSKVFDRVLPGPCAPWASCPCGVWSGSAPLCGGGGGGRGDGSAVCYPCGYTPPPLALTNSSSSSESGTGSSHGKKRMSDLAIALVSAGIGSGVMVAVAAVLMVYCLRRRRRGIGGGSRQDSGRIHAEPATGTVVVPPRVERRLSSLLSKGPNTTVEQFPLSLLRAATHGFSPSHRVGSGSFGAVYRASLPDGREVAIKRAEHRGRRDRDPTSSSSAAATTCRLKKNKNNSKSQHAEAAFVSELALLSRVNHKNLVRLLGFCADGVVTGERILVYEYMPNGTLHDHLHKHPYPPLSPPLATWPARLRLALGAARGIEYMHTYAVPPIIHRDIKSPNILLAADWTAKVADFGLSLLNHHNDDDEEEEPCLTAGTVGYMDPEYYRLQHLTDKSDVYSFGVLLLELLSGCKVIQRYEGSGTPKNVVDVSVPHIEADAVHRVLDARLPLPTPGEMEAVAYVGYLASDCVRPAGRDRPTMSDVVGVLERAVAACQEHDDDALAAVLSRSCTEGSTNT